MSGYRAADAWSSRSRRSAQWLAALAFAAAALAFCLLVFAGGLGPATRLTGRPSAIVMLSAGAMLGAAVFGQALWVWLAARRRGPSWAGAVAAAILTVPFANLLAWASAFVTVAADGGFGNTGGLAWLDEIGQVAMLIGLLTTESTIRFAHISLPLAIFASLATTLWYRRRLQRVDLPSYASPVEAGP